MEEIERRFECRGGGGVGGEIGGGEGGWVGGSSLFSLLLLPCLTSDSRHFLSSLKDLPVLRPRGSKKPKGAVAPASITSR